MKNTRYAEYNNYPYNHILKKSLEKDRITQSDHDLIINYIEDKLFKGIIEDARAQRIATSLTQWRRFVLVPYENMTSMDLLKAVANMRKGTTRYGKPYEPGTIRQQIKILKTFAKHLIKSGKVQISRDDLDEIKYPKEVFDSVKSKDLLTPEQVEKLIGAAVSIRDKAIIGLLADTGLRPSDVANLTWRDLDFNRQRIKVTVTTEKTTTPVNCYVILHKSWLEEYRKQRNMTTDGDFVFVDSNNGLPISYMGICHMLDRAAEKSKVKFPKRARAKLFRAVSITSKQRAGYSSANISKMHFGTPDSKMIRHYSKLVDEDAERESLEKSGVVVSNEVEVIRPDICNECNWPISPGVKFCPECGNPLTKEAADTLRIKKEWFEQQPEIQEVMSQIRSLEDMIKKIQDSNNKT